MDALSNPVRSRGKQASSADYPTQELPSVDLSLDKPLERQLVTDAKDIDAAQLLHKEYADALAFNEEPITISLSPTQQKNPPKWQECWVNGRGAEVLINGQWVQLGYLPMDQALTTKRKFVEVLLGSKVITVQTIHDNANVDSPSNTVRRVTTDSVHVQILEDENPRGREWLRRMSARAV